jgi:hypothetical protein
MSEFRLMKRFAQSMLVVPVALLIAAEAAGATSVALVGGGASGVTVSVNGPLGTVVLAGPTPTVTLPATGGGPFTQSLASLNVPGFLSAGVLTVSTQGTFGPSGFVQSSSNVANLNVGSGAVAATAVSSQCRIDAAGHTTGSTTLLSATALGATLPVNPAPNTSVAVAGVGTLTLNEQTSTTGPGGNRSITVNAVHLHLAGLVQGDVIVGQSVCRARI